MHKYRIEFNSQGIDEARLRTILEAEFGIGSASIFREYAIEPSAPVSVVIRNSSQQQILDLMANGKPWRRKTLLGKLNPDGDGKLQISRALMSLEEKGAIRKIQHGVYALAGVAIDSPTDIEPLNTSHERRTEGLALELLREPRTAPFLKDRLGVSRQRIDQILKKLMSAETVRRIEASGENGGYLYVLAELMTAANIIRRAPSLHRSRVRLLSTLSPETTVRLADIANVASVSRTNVSRYIESLEVQGLVSSFELGKFTYVTITPRGLQHPQYDAKVAKAPAADIVLDYGEQRVQFIEILATLGSAKTIEITDALPVKVREGTGTGSGQVIQRLESVRILERDQSEGAGHRSYRLTLYGQLIANVLVRVRPRPSVDELRLRIRERRESRTEKFRSRGSGTGSLSLSPPSISMIDALKEFGPLKTKEILSKMTVPFENPRSINLALRTLEGRGVVRCTGAIGNQKVWEFIPSLIDSKSP